MMSPQGGVKHEDTPDRFFGCPRQDLAGGRAATAIAAAAATSLGLRYFLKGVYQKYR